MMEGASFIYSYMLGSVEYGFIGLSHLIMIRISIHPNRPFKIIRPVTTSNQKTIGYLKYLAFKPFTTTPIDMWSTPIITDIFIFIEFCTVRISLESKNHVGSMPKGYTQYVSSYAVVKTLFGVAGKSTYGKVYP